MFNRGSYKAFALYGDAIWHLTSTTNLTAGLRLTRDEKRFSWYSPLRSATSLDTQLAALNAAGFYPSLVAAGALTQQDANTLQALTSSNQLINGQGASTTPLQVSKSWNNLSPRVVLDQHLDADNMVYGSVTRGYQAGGFNALAVNGDYAPETVTSFELGSKGQLRTVGLTYSLALFHYQYNNLQSLALVTSGNQSGVPAYEVSSSDEKADGVDLDLRWRATPHFTFLRRRRVHRPEIQESHRQRRHRSQRSARWHAQTHGYARRRHDVAPCWRHGPRHASGRIHRRDALQRGFARQGTCLTTPTFRVGGSMTRLDVRLGWDSASGANAPHWGAALVVNNLTDRRYVTGINYIAAGLGAPNATISQPRFVAVELHAGI